MSILKSTALYGRSFEATEQTDVYSLRVYTGGFAGVEAATSRARREAERFLEDSEYSGFEILGARRVWFPFSCVDVLVGFHHPNASDTGQTAIWDGSLPPSQKPQPVRCPADSIAKK